MKYRSKAERNADAMIRRANTQLRAAGRVFGFQSEEYKVLEKKVITAFSGEFDRYLTKDATGATQIRRTAENVRMVAHRPDGRHRTPEGKAVEQITKNMTVQQKKARLLTDYESRTGTKPKTKAEKDAAVKEQSAYMDELGDSFRSNLEKLYDKEKEVGYPLKAIDKIRNLSQGAGTDQDTLEQMNAIAVEALSQEYPEPSEGVMHF